VHVAEDPRFELDGKNVTTVVPVTPWEAALGARIRVATLAGEVSLTVPAGSSSGSRMRLRGKGMPGRKGGPNGDMFVELKIVVPKSLSDREKELFGSLAKESEFNPR
jgi:curved DNA-binding protein